MTMMVLTRRLLCAVAASLLIGPCAVESAYAQAYGSNELPDGLTARGTMMATDILPCQPNTSGANVEGCLASGLLAYIEGNALSLTSNATATITANPPLNGTYLAGGTNINLCPALASLIGCTSPGQFWGEGVLQATSQYGAVGQETTLTANMVDDSGYAATWTTSTAYAAGASVFNGANIYTTTTGGTSASSGAGPSGTGTGITDGTVTWNYAGPSYANGKQAIGCNLIATTNAAHSWCLALAAQALSGWPGGYMNPVESDASNFSAVDPAPSGNNTIQNVFLSGPVGTHPITNEIYIAPQFESYTTSTYGAYNFIWMNGPNGYANYGVWDSTTGGEIGYYISGSHVLSSISDSSTAPTGIDLAGHYSTAAIYVASGISTAISVGSGDSICLNGGSDCLVWTGSSIALGAQTNVSGDFYVTGSATNGNIYVRNNGVAQSWDLTAIAGADGTFEVYDATNGKTPLSIAGNSPNGALSITTTGVSIGETLTAPSVVTTPVAFASLPASPVAGQRAAVNNTSVCTFDAAVNGSGALFCPVIYTGSSWVAG
jgi:hypothetical protein